MFIHSGPFIVDFFSQQRIAFFFILFFPNLLQANFLSAQCSILCLSASLFIQKNQLLKSTGIHIIYQNPDIYRSLNLVSHDACFPFYLFSSYSEMSFCYLPQKMITFLVNKFIIYFIRNWIYFNVSSYFPIFLKLFYCVILFPYSNSPY